MKTIMDFRRGRFDMSHVMPLGAEYVCGLFYSVLCSFLTFPLCIAANFLCSMICCGATSLWTAVEFYWLG